MGLTNILLLSQIAGHVIAFILSLCVLVPISLHVHEFSGHCLLFATGKWQDDGFFNASWPSQIYCNYPIIISALLLILSIAQIYRFSRIAYKELEQSFLGLFLDVLFGVIFCVNILIISFIITLGFIVWCSEMTQRFKSCDYAAGQNITKGIEKIDTSGFYIQMGTAQFGAWASFAIWVGLSVFALLKLINNHQMRNMKVSMYIERNRLVQEESFRANEDEAPHSSSEII